MVASWLSRPEESQVCRSWLASLLVCLATHQDSSRSEAAWPEPGLCIRWQIVEDAAGHGASL
jgi:hypothetical protein